MILQFVIKLVKKSDWKCNSRFTYLGEVFHTKNLRCSFVNNNLVIAIASKKDEFEVCGLHTSLKNPKHIDKFVNQISAVLLIADYLKLYEYNLTDKFERWMLEYFRSCLNFTRFPHCKKNYPFYPLFIPKIILFSFFECGFRLKLGQDLELSKDRKRIKTSRYSEVFIGLANLLYITVSGAKNCTL